MSKRTMKACLDAANTALLEAKSKMRLKASILIVLTNYVKLRYGQAGNIRLRLYRNGFIRMESIDQSLTADLVKMEKVESDKVSVHEERNNLYAYLGKGKEFYPYISKKVKLTNADAVALYTRGIWEHVDEGSRRMFLQRHPMIRRNPLTTWKKCCCHSGQGFGKVYLCRPVYQQNIYGSQ